MPSAISSKCKWLWQHSFVSLILLFLLSIGVELLVFNHHFVFGSSPYARSSIDLPFNPQLSANVGVLTSQQNVLTLDQLSLKARNLKLKLGSGMSIGTVIEAVVEIKDQRSYPDFRPVSKIYLNPNKLNQDTAIAHFHAVDDQVLGVRITFNGPSYNWAALLYEVTFNAPEKLDFSLLRVTLMWLVVGVTYLVLRYRWYRVTYDHKKRTHRFLNYVMVLVCLGICFGFFSALSPKNTNQWAFDIFGEGLIIYTDAQHRLLLDLPKTEAEFYNCDAYTQLLDAFLKGQLNLDVKADPRLATMNNPYDFGEREKLKVKVTWDRPYYKGKYYVYFGMAPLLMAHAPIYFLTGHVPSLALACWWLGSLAVVAMLWGIRTMGRALIAKPNLLLFLGVQLAAVSSSLVWYLQVGLSHYHMPYITEIFWLGILVGSIYSLFTPRDLLEAGQAVGGSHLRGWLRRVLLLLAGVSIVLIVMSRPLVLLMGLVLTLPAVWILFQENYRAKLKPFCLDALFAVVPVVIGACFVMWYNYVRFESITEFGQSYQLTVDDNSANKLVFAWPLLRNSLYYYLFEPLEYSKEFPFVMVTLKHYFDTGNYSFIVDRVALFTLPMMWFLAVFLLPRRNKSTKQQAADSSPALEVYAKRQRLLWPMFWAWVVATVFLAYGMAYNAGVSGRYTMDIITGTSYLAAMAVLLLFQGQQGAGSSVFPEGGSAEDNAASEAAPSVLERGARVVMYLVALFFILKTVFIGVLVSVANDPSSPGMGSKIADMNPELMVYLLRFFMSWLS